MIEACVIFFQYILERDGQKAFAVLPYEEFGQIQQTLEDHEDLKVLCRAKQQEADAPTVSLEEAKKLLGV